MMIINKNLISWPTISVATAIRQDWAQSKITYLYTNFGTFRASRLFSCAVN